ncbi:MAG: matrixin family metalloprotease [Sandaracinaceae bacterium]|nr:matrixin family metalloprotease [Sandaracinaceae bacterium]
MNARAAKRLLVAASLAAALSAPAPSLGWSPITSTSPVWSGAVPYYLNNDGSPDLGGFSGTEPHVRQGMDDWTRVSCTSLTTSYRGGTSRRPGSYEGTSTIGWTESGWRHGSGAIGVTGPSWRGRTIVEADMDMNGVNYTWITGSGRGGNVNAYSIILHEGGHYYGLGHSEDRTAAMYYAYQGGISRLGTDDQNGICALYPGGGTDCTTTGCPSGQECVSGRCQAMMGDGTICSPCTADSDCGGSADLCLGYPDGRQYCGRACSSDADCSGDRCLSTSGGIRQCGRVSGTQVSCTAAAPGCTRDTDCPSGQICSSGRCAPGMGAALGAPCAESNECASGICRGGSCSATCNWADPTGSCPGGFYCQSDPSSCDTGYCVGGSPGSGALGASCGADTDCASALCANGRCSSPCIPGGTLGCPSGFACQVGTLPCRGSCQRSGALGDPCASNDDCTSRICAVTADRNFCTDYCDAANACPTGFTCTPAGDQSVCVPDSGGLGQPCGENGECVSGLCASYGDESFCTRLCNDGEPCPGGYDCLPTGTPGVGACSPTDPPTPMDGGCGCRAAGASAPALGAPLLLVALALFGGWRRRR